ncbi:hypothetical protein [Mucilaginibacter gotjawali]|uniref:Uncharacterized protein n=2 Tax=Mucilaginibacter gotjawali TaxID=1550579 RepID=A0A839S881_9SPHI|nr:hypothetical protein [Mucilaginibacter gotjawali]MBB3054145.1 hypothetical protein [Mucilaginibacter gotjawali]BAU54416.1 hypothetical protein MgSA37_02592 [Mucilaginibacter gotjawali]
MEEIRETGGARIGMANATWPMATLIVNRQTLQLKASIIGDLVFRPSDITSIEPYTLIPVLGQGIKINHTVPGYNAKVIFWTFGSPETLIRKIEQTGFLVNANPIPADVAVKVVTAQTGGSFPVKKSAAIAVLLIWNILFLYDIIRFFNGEHKRFPLGIGAQLALAFVFLISLLLLISVPVRNLILKPGMEINGIKSFLFLLMLITVIMFTAISIFPK